MKKIILLALTLTCMSISAQEKLKATEISGDKGGRLDGKAWSSEELTGKVHVLFYVDPDEKDTNEHVGQALKKENFSREVYQSWAIINMAATWLPNFALESALEKKQKMYPDTVYVKDFSKTLVKEWDLKDDASNVVLFNKNGEVLFKFHGKATDEQIAKLLELVKANL